MKDTNDELSPNDRDEKNTFSSLFFIILQVFVLALDPLIG